MVAQASTGRVLPRRGASRGGGGRRKRCTRRARAVAAGDGGAHAPAPEWVAARGGLPFDCTRCGACCSARGRDEYNSVFVSDAEARAIAGALGYTHGAFVERFTEVVTGDVPAVGGGTKEVTRRMLRFTAEGDCPLLDTTTKLCSVHAVKPVQVRARARASADASAPVRVCSLAPRSADSHACALALQCRTWPFWEELLVDEATYASEVQQVCPGSSFAQGDGGAPLVPLASVCAQRDETLAWEAALDAEGAAAEARDSEGDPNGLTAEPLPPQLLAAAALPLVAALAALSLYGGA